MIRSGFPCGRSAVRRPLATHPFLVIALAGFMASTTAAAATINVAAGVSSVGADGSCSLAEAINNANSDTQQDNADCPAGDGFDTIVLASFSTYVLDSALPAFNSVIMIEGNDSVLVRSNTVTCVPDGTLVAGEFRIITQVGSALEIRDLTITNGCADGAMSATSDGAGIRVDNGGLTLDNVVIEDNISWDKSGALDATNATVSISDSILRNNTAGFGGGAIGNDTTATMDIVRTTISGNATAGFGGAGIGNRGTMTVVNSTISGNTSEPTEAGGGGGGVGNSGDITLVNVTIAGNSDSGTGGVGGGGIANSGNVTVRNSIVANSPDGGDCVSLAGSFTAVDANLDTDGSCKALAASITTTTTGALALGPLAANGGPTATHRPGLSSSALDAIGTCFNGAVPVATDQRGIARPQVDSCDLGAVELSLAERDPVFDDRFEPALP